MHSHIQYLKLNSYLIVTFLLIFKTLYKYLKKKKNFFPLLLLKIHLEKNSITFFCCIGRVDLLFLMDLTLTTSELFSDIYSEFLFFMMEEWNESNRPVARERP